MVIACKAKGYYFSVCGSPGLVAGTSEGSVAGTGLQDVTRRSGTFLGNQFEARFRWEILPDNMKIEGGWALLVKGRFARNVPGTTNTQNPTYVYFQTTLTF